MILNISNAHFRYGAESVFCNVNCDIKDYERVGLVGINGAGKTTLLKCITGELSLFEGVITIGSGITIGYLHQNQSFESNNTVFEELLKVFSREKQLIEQASIVAHQLSLVNDDNEYNKLSAKYDRLLTEINRTDAYNVEVKVNTVINGMGLRAFADSVTSTLSGGEKTKVALCKLLLEQPQLLILDEPTNHLDYKTLDWLEGYLSNSKCALLIVSHDRYFLDKLCNKIWSMEGGTLFSYKGNYTQYVVEREQFVERQTKLYEQQQKEIAKLTDYIARNKVRASTANMAKSREKQLEKMEIVDKPLRMAQPPRFHFAYSTQTSEKVLEINKLTVAFGERKVLNDCELNVVRGQKIAIMGLNGTGKSTLLKHIVKNADSDLGKLIWGKNIKLGYYDQENLNLDKNLTVLDQLWHNYTRLAQTEVRNKLAGVGFVGEDVYKRVSQLSGGERAKLGLCLLTAGDNNLLVLDEPTNHLDLLSRGALEQALANYDGTIIFVSHDRYFVNSIANSVAELENGKLTVYKGNYEQFVEAKKCLLAEQNNQNQQYSGKESSQSLAQDKVDKKDKGSYRSAKQRADIVNRANKIKSIEKQILDIEQEEQQLNELIASKEVASNYELLNTHCNRLAELKQLSEQLYNEWESLQTE